MLGSRYLSRARQVAEEAASGLRRVLRLAPPWRPSNEAAGMRGRPAPDVGWYAWFAVAEVDGGPEVAVWVDRAAPHQDAPPPMLAVALRFPERPGLIEFLARQLDGYVSPPVRLYGPRHRDRHSGYGGMPIIECDGDGVVHVSRYWPSGVLPSVKEVIAGGARLFGDLNVVLHLLEAVHPDVNIDQWDVAVRAVRPQEGTVRAAVMGRRRPWQGRLRAELRRFGAWCAISGETAPQALEAAHIVPFAGDGRDDLHNALLLRADLHNLFDGYWININPRTLTVECDEALKSEEYRRFHRRRLQLPAGVDLRRYQAAFAERRRLAGRRTHGRPGR